MAAAPTHSLAPRESASPRRAVPISLVGSLLASLVPFALYVSTLNASTYWLDSGEFVEAAVNLDVAHPPGHPLTGIYGKLCSLLPFGSLAVRVALGQAIAASLGALLLFRVCTRIVRTFGANARAAEVPVALASTYCWALGIGVWFQAVRPEVYALQGLLSLLVLERLTQLQLASVSDTRSLYAATFVTGLGLTNHYVMGAFLFPALLFYALRAQRAQWLLRASTVGVLLRCTALGVLALLVYCYLPLRARAHLPANLGDPESWANFYWVISGQLYHQSAGKGLVPLWTMYYDGLLLLVDQFYLAFLLFAVLGALMPLRKGGIAARATAPASLVALTVIVVRPRLGFDHNNPDSVAYFMGGTAAIAALSSAGVAACLAALPLRSERALRPLWIVPGAVLALAVAFVRPEANLSQFHATDLFDESRVRDVPIRSVVIEDSPTAAFRQLELLSTERARPDVEHLPLPFLTYPGLPELIRARSPDTGELIASFLKTQRLDPRALARLAQRRPVLLDLGPHLESTSYDALLPRGLLYEYRARAPAGVPEDEQQIARALALRLQLAQRLKPSLTEVETRRQWLYLHFFDALYYAHRGRIEEAQAMLAPVLPLFPHERELAQLRTLLQTPGRDGRVDVSRFVRAAAEAKW